MLPESRELLDDLPDFCILTPPDVAWEALIQEICPDAKREMRYAIHREAVFDRARLLQTVLRLPEGYFLYSLEGRWFDAVLAQDWSRDFCALFDSKQDYARRGLGVVAVYDGEIVAGASSYACYADGIEIEVDTRADHRQKGLAYACSAQLILLCLERGMRPYWDAANQISVHLAEKLGFRYAYSYPVYFYQKQKGAEEV